jgi:hypothetical protein
MSPTLSATTSEMRSPAPPAFAGAGSGGGKCRLVLRPRRRLEQQRDLLDAQYSRQPARFAYDREPSGKVRPVERDGEEETQGRDRAVDAWRLHAGLRLVQLEAAQILRRRRVGRPANEGRECPHIANIVVARLLGEAAHPHVLDHARPQRADGPVGRMGGHRGILSRAEGCWTFDAQARMPRSSRRNAHPGQKRTDPHARSNPARAGSFLGRRQTLSGGAVSAEGHSQRSSGASTDRAPLSSVDKGSPESGPD